MASGKYYKATTGAKLNVGSEQAIVKVVKGPYLQWSTTDSITVMWETSVPATSEVQVLTAERIHSGHQGNYRPPRNIAAAVKDDEPVTVHRVTLTGLEPSSTYFYKLCSRYGYEIIELGPYPLKTAPLKGEPFSFTVTSETGGFSGFDQSGGQWNRNIFAQMANYRPDLALFVGDIVNDGRNDADWEQYFFGPGREFLRSTPSYCCLGNHEYNASQYYQYFSFAPPGNYYAFDYGDARFICLDSTDFIKSETYPHSKEGELLPGNAQYDFLVRELSAATAKWTIVFFHYSPYVSGGYEVEELRCLSPLFEQYGVDLVLTSHTIVYERSYPLRGGNIDFDNGVVYIVCGGAGAMPEWQLPKREWFTSQSLAVPHFLQVAVAGGRMEVRAIDHEGRLFDMLHIRKDANGKKQFI